ncbi:sensor histidine kinase [Streptomyces radicis]|uniref:histidine kinase n=1 Tax=Streptomyces radicis TaxID=1750517 RepID=A0A3A9WHE2_9ACTN|nr:sensor histidine kinase [Streptomyces radicis]RKN26084.1 sensor histidine kinase [Streptomyces radicis]
MTVLVVALALTVGSLVLIGALRANLTDDVRDDAGERARAVAAAVEEGRTPSALALGMSDEELVQILDEHGRVVASGADIAGRPAMARLRPGDSTELRPPPGEDEDFVAVAAGTADGRHTVLVARPLVDVLESTAFVTRTLAFGLSALLVLVALATWKGVGRALAPVERIRAEVDAISAAQLHRRVPEPAGNDEITRLAATMNRMLDRLERAQRSQRRFISDASHELRSPVAAIRQHAEVALAHPGRTAVPDLAATVLAEDVRIQRLVDDLLLLARADEHTLGLRHRPVDLDDLVLDEARRLRATTPLVIDTASVSAGRVDGDPAGLQRILRNLSDNAARHAGSRVAFTLRERAADGTAGPTVLLRVDDDGPGIPEEERERVRERFVRLDDARARDQGGSGLGLAIVSELVAAHDGALTIAESDLGGARIEITFPRGPDS